MTRPLRQVPDVRADEASAQLIEARIDRGVVTPDEVRKVLGGASAIREYLEAKAAEHPKEWLRREPRVTHPEILDIVREFVAEGGFANDEAERRVNVRAGDLPEHRHHGHEDRHRLSVQLGHEVYLSRCIVADEKNAERLAALLADGFEPLDGATIVKDARYLLCVGLTYSGQDLPSFGEPREVRAWMPDGPGWSFLPKGARTRGFAVRGAALVKAAS